MLFYIIMVPACCFLVYNIFCLYRIKRRDAERRNINEKTHEEIMRIIKYHNETGEFPDDFASKVDAILGQEET